MAAAMRPRSSAALAAGGKKIARTRSHSVVVNVTVATREQLCP
jgi:hypothetical protein